MQKFPNHFHEHYVIGFIESGCRHLSCKGRDYTVMAGDLLLFNPMDNHACEQADTSPLDYRCINIKPAVMGQAVREVTGRELLPQFTQTVLFHSELVPLLQELHEAIMAEQRDFRKEELFFFLIEQLVKEYAGPQTPDAPRQDNEEIQAVCRYIDDHFKERISLDELSRLSGMNKYTLLRSFTRSKGITPYCYLETVRINEAKHLLESGTPLVDTALLTGFTDQSHFTNNFKDYIGLTPKQYQTIFKDG